MTLFLSVSLCSHSRRHTAAHCRADGNYLNKVSKGFRRGSKNSAKAATTVLPVPPHPSSAFSHIWDPTHIPTMCRKQPKTKRPKPFKKGTKKKNRSYPDSNRGHGNIPLSESRVLTALHSVLRQQLDTRNAVQLTHYKTSNFCGTNSASFPAIKINILLINFRVTSSGPHSQPTPTTQPNPGQGPVTCHMTSSLHDVWTAFCSALRGIRKLDPNTFDSRRSIEIWSARARTPSKDSDLRWVKDAPL